MKPKLFFLLISALVTLTTLPALAAGPMGSINLGHWSGGAFTNEKTGAFSHCAASAGYQNGFLLTIGQNAERTWLLAIANPSWNLTLGETFPIDLTFDGQAQFHFFASANSPIQINGILPSPAAERLRKSHLMIAAGKLQTVPFDLKDVSRLLPAIALCVDHIKASGLGAAADFVLLAKKTTAPAALEKAANPEEKKPTPKLVDKTGSGFVISETGHVVTNHHVIDKCVGEIRGNLTGESTSPLRIVSTDEINDLALLQVSGKFKEAAAIRSTPVHSGDAVIAIGYPFHGLLTSDFTVTTGIVNSLSGLLNDTRFLQISAPIQPGNSGGPLLDISGHVVGVVAEKLNALKFATATGNIPENISFAIKPGALRDFLDNSVVPSGCG